MPTLPLAGRVAVVSGVSRRRGIGFAVAKRLAAMGASLFIQHYRPHDAGQPWGADHIDDVLAELQAALVTNAHIGDVGLDLTEAHAAETLVGTATSQLGHLDVLVCNHAQSGNDGPVSEVTSAQLDQHWQVNARSTVLATRAFAAQHDGREGWGPPAPDPIRGDAPGQRSALRCGDQDSARMAHRGPVAAARRLSPVSSSQSSASARAT
ncbi:MAG: SDR family oxidoreductase [Nocardioidaceae bacterium]